MANVSSSNGLEKRPKLRFPGFDEQYKQCRIGDIYAERSQRGASDMELLSVTMNDGVKPRSEIEGKDNSSEDKSNYKIVRKGDMVYNSMRMWQGANGISPCDGIVSPAYTVLMPKQEINNGYFAALFKSTKLINEFRKNSQGMTSDTWNLKYPQIETIKVQIPSVSEQDKVSALFSVLDARIVAQAQLVESLKKYKRGVVKALISGSRTFTDADHKKWETVSLAEIFNISAGGDIDRKNSSSSYSANHPYPVFANALTNSGLYGYANYFKIEGDSITVSGRGEVGHAIARHCKYVPIVRLLSLVPKYDDDVDFFAYMINATSIYIESTGVPQLTSPQLGAVKVLRPPVSEQKRISSFLLKLDVKVEKEERLILRMEKVKAAMLQQLFI
jgi:type I restriction enzyme S subunit